MDEYISRQEAIKALYEVYEHDYPTASGDFDEYARHDVRNVLNGLPSADVQPVKHGRWILCDDGYVRCSECNCKAFIENDETIITDFCHGCGADLRMDGDKDNNVRNLTDEETAIYESWIESEAKDTDLNIMEGDSE